MSIVPSNIVDSEIQLLVSAFFSFFILYIIIPHNLYSFEVLVFLFFIFCKVCCVADTLLL